MAQAGVCACRGQFRNDTAQIIKVGFLYLMDFEKSSYYL